jgi:adenylate cyclase
LRIILLVTVIIVFMMVSLRRFLEKKIIRPMEAVAEANRRLDVAHPELVPVPLDHDAAVEIKEIVSTRAKMLEAILNVSNQRLAAGQFHQGHLRALSEPEDRR